MISLIVFYVGIILLIISLIMVLRYSYPRSMLWTLLIAFVPFVVFLYIGLNWKELFLRKALYLIVVALLTTAVGIFGGALEGVPYLPEHPAVETLKKSTVQKQGPLPNQEQAEAVQLPEGDEYDPVLSGSKFEQLDIKPLPPSEDKSLGHLKTIERKVRLVDLSLAPYLIGRQTQLSLVNGQSPVGVLIRTTERGLVLDQSVDAGTIEFSYAFEKIQSMQALVSDTELAAAQAALVNAEQINEVNTEAENLEHNGEQSIETLSGTGQTAAQDINDTSGAVPGKLLDSDGRQQSDEPISSTP